MGSKIDWGRETKSVAALLVFAIKTCNIAQLNSIIFHLKKTIPQNNLKWQWDVNLCQNKALV